MADMVSVFSHDEALKAELVAVTNKRLAERATDFLDAVTDEFNSVIFRVLKICYVPTLCMNLQSGDESEKAD